MPKYWLLKTEPTTYSFEQLQKDRKTAWNGIRNFQARNFVKQIAPGDLALIYHSGDDRAVCGISRAVGAPYVEHDKKKPGEWYQVDLEAVKPFKSAVPLAQIKTTPSLKDLMLIRQSRLSVMPITAKEFETLLKLGGTSL